MKEQSLYQKVYKYQFSYSFGIQQAVKKKSFFSYTLGSLISQLRFHQHLHYFLFLLPNHHTSNLL
jgi:hypothetical protein